MVTDWAVMVGQGGLYLNFYGPGTVHVPLPEGDTLTLRQSTQYPLDGTVMVGVEVGQPLDLTLHLRIPAWSHKTVVRVNGTAVDGVRAGSYLALTRTWHTDDRIELNFDMGLHFWLGERECAGKVSIYRGPLLLAYDQRYNAFDPAELPTLNVQRLNPTLEGWEGPLAPWLLVRVTGHDGTPLMLCDFANAGMVGTEYRSWLPVAGATPMLESGVPVWAARATA
jgi:hypothetical protein